MTNRNSPIRSTLAVKQKYDLSDFMLSFLTVKLYGNQLTNQLSSVMKMIQQVNAQQQDIDEDSNTDAPEVRC